MGGVIKQRRIIKDSVCGISTPSIRRLARRAEVKRISKEVYNESRGILRTFVEDIIKDALIYTKHANRKTVTAMDITLSLKSNNTDFNLI